MAVAGNIIRNTVQVDQLGLLVTHRHIYPMLSQQILQSLNPRNITSITVVPQLINSIELTLQINYGLIPLIQSWRQPNHDVSLLQQQVFVSLHVHLIIFQLLPLTLKLIQFGLVFLSYHALTLLQSWLELRCFLDVLTTDQHLWGEHFNSGHQSFLLLFFLGEFLFPIL